MKDELENKLVKEFPNLYKQTSLSPQETCMCWGFCCGDGWEKIIYNLSKKITELVPNVEAVQVGKIWWIEILYWTCNPR